jgi:hypothetical protein
VIRLIISHPLYLVDVDDEPVSEVISEDFFDFDRTGDQALTKEDLKGEKCFIPFKAPSER